MKRKWTMIILILATIGGIAGFAQFSSLREVADSIYTFAFTPRINGQYFKIDANTPKQIPFMIEPGYQSFLVVSGKTQISYRLLNEKNVEVQTGPDTYNVIETLKNGFYAKTFRFTANTSSSGTEMWTVEITSTVETTISFLNGNKSASNRGIAVAVENGMPELNEATKVFVLAHNFDNSKNKVELRKSKNQPDPGVLIDIRDDGIYPDEVPNDHRFTGIAPTDTIGSFGMVATLFQKTWLGEFASVQTTFDSYTVYQNTMRVVDSPKGKLLFHELYGVPVGIELTFDIDVVTPGNYIIAADIFGKDASGQEVSSHGNNMPKEGNTVPFYPAGRQQITTIHGFDHRAVDWLTGSVGVQFHITDQADSRVVEKITSKSVLNFPRDQLVRKRFKSYEGDRLVDTNGDGDPDAMEVKFSANVYKSGIYLWSAVLRLSEDSQFVGDSGTISDSMDGEGQLGVGLHHFTVNVPLEKFWTSKAKGTFDITPVLVIQDSGEKIAPLKETDNVFKSQYYDLTLGISGTPKTLELLIQTIKDAKTLRPADGIKAELIAKVEDIQKVVNANNIDGARGGIIDFLDLLDRVSNDFSEHTLRILRETSNYIFDIYQNGQFK
jgi:hypothetical protein